MCDSLVIGVVPARGVNGRIMVPSVHLLIVMKPNIIQLTWHCSLVGSLRRWRTDDGTFLVLFLLVLARTACCSSFSSSLVTCDLAGR